MNARIFSAFASELEKHALVERLIRLGATDIPKTPRLFMRQRGPQELQALQDSVTAVRDKRLKAPIMQAATKGLNRLPQGKVRSIAGTVAETFAEDPIGTALSSAIPVPGASALYVGGKKALERGIDRAFPLGK